MLLAVPLFCTLAAAALVLRLRGPLAVSLARRQDHRAVQASHVGAPLRFGGMAAFAGLGAGVLVVPDGVGQICYLILLASVLPVFAAGLAEDLGHAMSPRRRLVAAAISAGLAVGLLQFWVGRADLALVDPLMAVAPVGIAVTVLFSAGFCHAFNLIDGMNGLAAVNAMLSALGLAYVAQVTGAPDLGHLALVIMACMAGFLVFNWPVARLFLGDAGAYGIGHLLTWLAVLLVARDDLVAVPALLLILFWPLADVFHTLLRRLAAGKTAFAPDRMHLHHKVRRALDMVFFGYNAKARSNPLATAVMTPLIALPVLTGALLHGDPAAAWVALLGYSLVFAGLHRLTPRLACRYRKI